MTAKTTSTITVKNGAGNSVTINVGTATTYQTRGKEAATLADVAVGDVLVAEGILNSDGSLDATAVRFGQAGPGGFNGPRIRGGFGPGKGFGPGGNLPNPNASPAPSASAG